MNSKNDEMCLGINQSNTIRYLFLDGVKCIPIQHFKYYLIHEKECFIIFKTRGAAERFRCDKTRLFECIK